MSKHLEYQAPIQKKCLKWLMRSWEFVMIMKHDYNPLPWVTSNITAQDVEDP